MRHFRRSLTLIIVLAILLGVVASAGASPQQQGSTYTVKGGDTLYKISRATGTSVSDLINLNGPTYPSLYTNPSLIYVGWVFKLSAGATTTGGSGTASGGTYTVQAGDYLSSIARKTGTSVSDLITLNGPTYPSLYTNPGLIYVGWVFKLSAGAVVDNTTTGGTDGGTTGGTTGGDGGNPPPSTTVTSGFEVGGQTHGLGHPGEMRYAGMTWVKYQVKWGPGSSPDGEAGRLNNAHNQGFKVLFSVTGPDHPNSINYSAYANYVAGLAGLGADGIEIWNEMNFDREWPAGEISGANYVNNMLRPSYNAIKVRNPGTMVISGAPTPTGAFPYCGADIGGLVGCNDDTFIRQMAAAGAANVADCIGVHYNAGTTSPYATSGAPNAYHYSWYYQPMVNLYYGAFGGARKLCFTEIGYLVGEGTNLPGGFSWASGTSVAEHAQWHAENVSLAGNSGRVRLYIVWNVDIGDNSGGDPQGGYSIIRGGGCPACETIRGVTGGG